MSAPWRAAALACLACWAATAADPSRAQPDPSVRTDCAGLRAALAALPPFDEDEMVVTIAVSGRVTAIARDDAVSYVSLCAPPDPRVVCVTYVSEGRQVGDVVTVAGGYTPGDGERVVLDPCLHFARE